MPSRIKRIAGAALVGCLFVMWGIDMDEDVVAAQRQSGIAVTRIFTGPDGQTHAEDITISLKPSGPLGAMRSDMLPITGVQFGRNPAGWVLDWHNAPRRQYVITLSGTQEIEMGGGKKIRIGPGHILLAEDLTGKGHITRVIGSEDRVALYLPVAEK
jgi:hypothetical protein